MPSQRRIPICLVLAVVVALACAAPSPAHGPGARAWLTTGDRSSLLAEQPPEALGALDPTAPTIAVDPTGSYQRIEGLGASITDSSAHLLADSPDRDAIMRSLFDPRDGLGLSYLRQPMGASDFVAGPHYTYDDVPAGQTDFRLKHFSTAHDRAEILPLLRQAIRLNPNLKIMATPWSPPAWMKTSDSLVGGRFKDDPRVYDAHARYFVRFVQEYRRAGVPIDAVTLQNEPQNRHPSEYPGMDLRDGEEARLVVAVGGAFQRAGIHTKILGYDHNWSLHPNDVGPPDDPGNPLYAKSLLDNAAARHYLAGYDERIRLHGYAPEPMDKDEVRGFYGAVFAAFDSPQLAFHEVLWDGDACTIRFTMTRRHVGEFMGVPATGTDIALPGITILHFEGERVIERFSQADMLGVMVQLGAVPAPA